MIQASLSDWDLHSLFSNALTQVGASVKNQDITIMSKGSSIELNLKRFNSDGYLTVFK